MLAEMFHVKQLLLMVMSWGHLLLRALNSLVSFKSVYSMVYWSENVYIITSIRSCPFSQGPPAIALAQARRAGAIYEGQGMWPNMWGLDEPGKDSQGFQRGNPTYLTTARPRGIFFEISPFKNSHDLL